MPKNSTSKQVFWFSLINYLGVVIGIVSTLFIYPQNTEFLGIVRTIEAYSQVIFPLLLLGASQALVHFYPVLNKQYRNRLFLYSLSSVLGNSILVFCGLFLILKIFNFNYAELVWIAFPIGIAIALNEVFKRQALNLHKIAIPTLFEKLIPKLILPLAFILIGTMVINELEGILIFVSAYVLILIFTSIYTVSYDQTRWDTRFRKIFVVIPKKEYLRYSMYAFTGSLGSLLAFRIDTIMLNMLDYPMDSIGIYSIGIVLASTLAIPATGIFAIHSPLISDYIKNDKVSELGLKYKETAKLLFALGAIFYSCIFLGIDDLFSLLPAYDKLALSIPVILVLGIGIVVNMGTGFNSEIITYSNFYRFNVAAILLMIFLNIGLNLLFLLYFNTGIIGVAYSSCISLTAFNLLKINFIYQKFGILPFDIKYAKLLCIVVATGIILYVIPNIPTAFWNLIVKVSLCLFINFLLIYKMKLVPFLNQKIENLLHKNRN
jgi:O-antigen/teichoic acid export membrane protein